jgi:hypothetical protein
LEGFYDHHNEHLGSVKEKSFLSSQATSSFSKRLINEIVTPALIMHQELSTKHFLLPQNVIRQVDQD